MRPYVRYLPIFSGVFISPTSARICATSYGGRHHPPTRQKVGSVMSRGSRGATPAPPHPRVQTATPSTQCQLHSAAPPTPTQVIPPTQPSTRAPPAVPGPRPNATHFQPSCLAFTFTTNHIPPIPTPPFPFSPSSNALARFPPPLHAYARRFTVTLAQSPLTPTKQKPFRQPNSGAYPVYTSPFPTAPPTGF